MPKDHKENNINLTLSRIAAHLENLEKNQLQILQNQSILSNGLDSITTNQQYLFDKLEKLEQNMKRKLESPAQSPVVAPKLICRKIEPPLFHMKLEVDDKFITEISRLLPLNTIDRVMQIENMLEAPEYVQAMIAYTNKLKGTSDDVGTVMRSFFTDEVLKNFNWDGTWDKQPLAKLVLVNKVLRDVFEKRGGLEFEKSVRKSVERSHHRSYQKKYLKTSAR